MLAAVSRPRWTVRVLVFAGRLEQVIRDRGLSANDHLTAGHVLAIHNLTAGYVLLPRSSSWAVCGCRAVRGRRAVSRVKGQRTAPFSV